MKCNFCGYEAQENFAVCPVCNKEVAPAAVVNPVGEKVMAALKDSLFLVLCILMTVGAFFGLLSDGFDVISILFCVFSWIVYSKSRNNIVDTNQLRNLSGTVYAQYIVCNVSACIMIVCGIVSAILMGVLGGAGIFDSLISQFDGFGSALSGVLALASGWIILALCIVAGGVLLVLSLLGWRKIHRFAKSVYQSINTYTEGVVCAAAAKNWVLAFGILEAVSAVTSGSFTGLLSGGCQAAATIIAYLLIGKYLADKQ